MEEIQEKDLDLLADFVAGFIDIRYPNIRGATSLDVDEIFRLIRARLDRMRWPRRSLVMRSAGEIVQRIVAKSEDNASLRLQKSRH